VSGLRRALDALAAPFVQPRVPAADSLVVQHGGPMRLNNPAAHLYPDNLVTPSLAIRSGGLPQTLEPRFGTQTWYFDPEVLRDTRVFRADAYTPGSERVWENAPLLGDTPEEGFRAFWSQEPIRNNEILRPRVSVSRGSMLAGLTPESDLTRPTQLESLRRGLLSADSAEEKPFSEIFGMVRRLGDTTDTPGDETRWLNRMMGDNLTTGGGFGRGSPLADVNTRIAISDSLTPAQRAIWNPWVEEQLARPVTYAEAKGTGFIPMDAVRAATGSHYFNANSQGARELFNMLGREVPVAPAFGHLPRSALSRLMFSGGGVAPWMIGLGGEE
jgi:hypothetical protein